MQNFAKDNILNINLKKEFFNINFVSQLTFIKICFILKKKLNIKNIVFMVLQVIWVLKII